MTDPYQQEKVHSLAEVTAKIGRDFSVLRSGSNEEIKEVKKRLTAYRYGWACHVDAAAAKAFLENEIAQLDSLDDRHLKAVLEGFTIFWLQSSCELRFLFLDLVLRYIHHSNGGIREAARHFAKSARLSSLRKSETDSKKYLQFLKRYALQTQEQRKAAHVSEAVRSYDEVVDLPPSPYKSMCLAWESLNSKNVHECWIDDEDAVRLGMPVLTSDNEVEEGPLTVDDVIGTLWKKGEAQKALPALQRLEASAIHRFEEVMRAQGFAESEIKTAYGVIHTLGPWEGGTMVFTHLVEQKLKNSGGKAFDLRMHAALLRATQGLVNNLILKNTKGEPFSALVVGAVLQRETEGRHIPRRLPAFLAHCADTHDAVDQVIPLVCAQRQVAIDEVKERETHIPREFIERGGESFSAFLTRALDDDMPQYAALTSIAHHALDWYIQVEPWGVERCTPKKLAARIFDALRDIHMEHKSTVFNHMPKSFFSQFGGWATPGGVNNYMVPEVLRNVRDIDIILVEPIETKMVK